MWLSLPVNKGGYLVSIGLFIGANCSLDYNGIKRAPIKIKLRKSAERAIDHRQYTPNFLGNF